MKILLLRIIHSFFAFFFISCIIYIYYSAYIKQMSLWVVLAIFVLALEGFLVFIVNKGDCPLAPLQYKLGDNTPFFNLFLPAEMAKKAVPFFTLVTIVGIVLLVINTLL